MRLLFRLLTLVLFATPLAVLALGWFALAEAPLVRAAAPLSHTDIARAEEILRNNDLRRLPAGRLGTVSLSAADLNLVAGYLLKQTAGADSQARLNNSQLTLTITRQLPQIPMRRYLNLTLTVQSSDGEPRLGGLQVGDVGVPAALARAVLWAVVERLPARDSIERAIRGIQSLELSTDTLRLHYQWNPALIDDARETLLTDVDKAALRVYHDKIVALQQQGIGRHGALSDLLQPLFVLARARSDEGQATLENTALLSVLGAWAGRHDLRRLVPGDIARPSRFRLRLRGRRDFAQHFLVSAGLAARGDSTLSNAVGLFKEIVDADHGSGFSFTDIAADQAGSRFGELAAASASSASRLQQRIALGIRNDDLLPEVADLPEFLDAAEFENQFEHVGSPAYDAMMDKISRRIDALPLYQRD